MAEVWILGGTGRVGRGVAEALAASGVSPVLVGRDAGRLRAAVGDRGYATYVAPDLDAAVAGIRAASPSVVVSTVGPFGRTAGPVVGRLPRRGERLRRPRQRPRRRRRAPRPGRGGRAGGTHARHRGRVRRRGDRERGRLAVLARRLGRNARSPRRPGAHRHAAVAGHRGGRAGRGPRGHPGRRPAGGRGRRTVPGPSRRRRPAGARAARPGRCVELVTPDGDRLSAGLMPLGRARRGAAGERRARRRVGLERGPARTAGPARPPRRDRSARRRPGAPVRRPPAGRRPPPGPSGAAVALLGPRPRDLGRRHDHRRLAAARRGPGDHERGRRRGGPAPRPRRGPSRCVHPGRPVRARTSPPRSAAPTPVPKEPDREPDRRPDADRTRGTRQRGPVARVPAGDVPRRTGALHRTGGRRGRRRGARRRGQPGRRRARRSPAASSTPGWAPGRARHRRGRRGRGGRRRRRRVPGRRPRRGARDRAGEVPERPRARRVPAVRRPRRRPDDPGPRRRRADGRGRAAARGGTAAAALFEPDQLGLALPPATSVPTPEPGSTVLVWGGSTSVGNNAVQLAAAAGHRVLATASPRNDALVRGLGAAEVVDYRDPPRWRRSSPPSTATRWPGRSRSGAGRWPRPCASRDAPRAAAGWRPRTPGPATAVRRLLAQRHGVRVSAVWGGRPARDGGRSGGVRRLPARRARRGALPALAGPRGRRARPRRGAGRARAAAGRRLGPQAGRQPRPSPTLR